MKFMIFSAQYLPTVGGVERYTNSLSKKLVEKGHGVTVITSLLPGLPEKETDSDGIEIIRLPVIPVMSGRFPVIILGGKMREFAQYFGKNPPDFCVIQTRFYTNSIFAAKLCKKYSIPAIVVEHGTAHLMHGGIMGFLGGVYEHTVFKYIRRRCPDFYGVSAACCKWLEHFGVKTDKVLSNSVSPEFLTEAAQAGKDDILNKLPRNIGKKTTIFFSARFVPEKGVRQLLSAFTKINRQYPDTLLIMAGSGPIWREIQSKKPENVILTGQIPYEENLALMQMSDIFCLPTFSEGFATTILEAAALKTVIVTTPTGGAPNLIKNESYGILIPDMSEKSIVEGLKKALSDSHWRETAAENAYKNLTENFTWDKTADKLISVAERKIEELQ